MRRSLLALTLAVAVSPFGVARAEDPILEPGRDPGGTAVAVLADGFDYTRPELARVLARDGEGVAIAWDAVDRDQRPFAAKATGTDVALAVTSQGGARVVAVRVDPGDAASLAQGIGFAAATPARIVIVHLDQAAKGGLDVLEAAGKRFEALLIVGTVPNLAAEEVAKDRGPNVLVLDGRDDGTAAGQEMARGLGCGQDALAGGSGADLKSTLLARLKAEAPSGCHSNDYNAKGKKP